MTMTSVEDALARVLTGVEPVGLEDVRLRDAAGRTLARSVKARITQPPFDASAMDGYAVIAADCAAPPARVTLIGQSAAGRPFSGAVSRGQAVRIFTGAEMPSGADAVVIQEDTEATGDSIVVRASATAGQHIRRQAQDFSAGDALIDAGRSLTARDILLAGASGAATLTVWKKPLVAIVATGDELVEPGGDLRAGQVFASNGYAIAALVEHAGASARLLAIARDTRQSLANAIDGANDADILVTIGGASVGDHDLVRPALEAAGARIDFYKITMRPGKPLFFGARQVAGKMQRVLGLPGNPVSALITARVFLAPLVARMLKSGAALAPIAARLAAPLPENGPRTHFMRATLDDSVAPPSVRALPSQDSSLTRALAAANCLIVVQPNAPAMDAGATVDVLKLDF